MANLNRRGIPMPFVSRSRRVDPPSTAPQAVVAPAARRSSMVDSAIYAGGVRVASPHTLAETYRALRRDARRRRLDRPVPARPSSELMSLADEFDLHQLAVEDAIVAHQRPKLERYGDTSLRRAQGGAATWTRPRRSTSASCTSSSARTSSSPSATASRPTSRTVRQPDGGGAASCSRSAPQAILYAIIDAVVDGYSPVVAGLAERHRRDRDPGVRRRRAGLPAHLRAVPRGDRLPAGHPAAVGDADALERGFAKYGVTRNCSATCATSPTTSPRSTSASTASASCCATS